MNGAAIEVETRPRKQRGRARDRSTKGAHADGKSGPSRRRARYAFDPQGHVRAGRLRLADQCMKRGQTYQAIAAYGELLGSCAGTYAADAAVEQLLEIARTLERQGQYYTAQAILRKIDESYRS